MHFRFALPAISACALAGLLLAVPAVAAPKAQKPTVKVITKLLSAQYTQESKEYASVKESYTATRILNGAPRLGSDWADGVPAGTKTTVFPVKVTAVYWKCYSGGDVRKQTIVGELEPLRGHARLGHKVIVNYYAQAHEGLRMDVTVLDEIRRIKPLIKETEARTLLGRFLFSGDDVFKQVGTLLAGRSATVLVTGYWNVFLDGDVAAIRGVDYMRNSIALTRAENTQIAAAARAQQDTYVDIYTPFKGDSGAENDTSLLAPDGDHPNAAGHHTIALALESALTSR